MPATPATHPSADTLQSFGLGKLDDAAAEEILRHLENCPDCHKQVAALSGDSFLDKLRDAHGRSGTPAPDKSLSGIAKSLQATRQPQNPPAAIPDLPVELVNNAQYEVVRELGRGGMGVVYLARNVMLDRPEVLKVVSKALLKKPGAEERFLREMRSAAKLSHDNVVKAYSALSLGELLVFAMEYVEGQDLAQLVKQQGPLPVTNACFYAHQAAMGLQHAHEHGMIHRDIKPHNLILARQGKKHIVKVLDFGLAKATREGDADTDLTGAGKMMGTPDYIAPEQTLDAASADIRADIYSLGCTLYFLLTGAPPFKGKSLYEVLQGHMSMDAKPLDKVRVEVPAGLSAVVAKMMAKEPGQRYQKPVEVAQALAPFVKAGVKAVPTESSGKGATPKEAGRTETLMEGSATLAETRKRAAGQTPRASAPKVAFRKWWLVGAGAGVAVLLLALVVLWAGGVFKVKTKDGTIVLENLSNDAEVLVDGEKVTVTWGADRKSAEITVKPGTHQIEAKQGGVKVIGEKVEIEDRGRTVLTAHLEPKDPPLPDKEWVSLFNGKDKSGWKTHPSQPGNWRVENGVLIGAGPAVSHLYTERGDLENFHLRVEVRIEQGSNSGIAFRSHFGPDVRRSPGDTPIYPAGYGVQINCTNGFWRKTGSLSLDGYDLVVVRESPVKDNQWFTLEVLAEGDYLTVKVNERTTAVYRDAQRRFTRGHVTLIAGVPTRIEYRKIDIKELPVKKS
jgi:serine/threonine protein kinase